MPPACAWTNIPETFSMPTYRRLRAAGATYFFSVNLEVRGGSALTDHIDLLREAYRTTVTAQPIHCGAMVILPDHIHAVWTLPSGDTDVSGRWRKIKGRFTHAIGLRRQSSGPVSNREARLWQRRFLDHMIRDADEERRAIAYCLGDPVRHGLVTKAEDWPFSTLHRDLRSMAGAPHTLRAVA